MARLRRELSFSHLLELARIGLDQQVFVSRYLTRLPTEGQLRSWLAEERETLARREAGED